MGVQQAGVYWGCKFLVEYPYASRPDLLAARLKDLSLQFCGGRYYHVDKFICRVVALTHKKKMFVTNRAGMAFKKRGKESYRLWMPRYFIICECIFKHTDVVQFDNFFKQLIATQCNFGGGVVIDQQRLITENFMF